MTDAPPPADLPRPPRKAMFIAALVVAIDLLGFGIVLPLLPRLAKEYLAGQTEAVRGATIGALFSVFSLMQFIFSPMWGRMSDRIGRRPVLLIGLIGSAVFYALFAFASSLPTTDWQLALALMFLSRIGAGIAGANIGAAAAVIADCTTREKRAKGMALIGAAFGIGFTFGPLIAYAGLKAFEDQKWGVGAIASILSLVAAGLAFAWLPETRIPGQQHEPRSFFSISRTLDVIKMPSIGPLVLIYFLAIFGFANFEATLALLTSAAFDYNDEQNFLVFAAVGFILMVAQGGLYRPLVGRWKEGPMIVFGIALMFLGLGLIGVVAWFTATQPDKKAVLTLFYLAMALAVTGFAFVNPSVSAMVSKRADPHRQGEVIGVNQSAASLGRILGPFVGVFVFELHSTRTLPYLVAMAALVCVLLLLPTVLRKESGTRNQEPEVLAPPPVA
ncbi:MFS transporter [Limnoglobus roseus]|uniref:MFS transporter n=1 Tax=Limnoglobus roseus TaxID=2598579 RepID=A0A5C1A4Z6_9BACT|nr:MFS transporter [Limnoglobus roseus]QEL13750.1 MFS transporter [Limnoglobus roseus]